MPVSANGLIPYAEIGHWSPLAVLVVAPCENPGVSDEEVIAAVAREFDLGPIQEISRPPSGTMNETYLVRAGGRRVVARRHRRLDRSVVDREHEIMSYARRRGVPVPVALRTRDGDHLVRHTGKWHSVFAYAPGGQVNSVDAGQARSMGVMLAQIHRSLADFPVEPTVRERPSVSGTMELLRRIQREIRQDSDEDRAAIAYLESKADAVRASTAPPPMTEQQQLVHGDYQHTNVFFENGAVVAVIDWDKAEARLPTQEIARTMDLSLRMDPALCRAFVAGYREMRPLDPTTLDAGAAIYDFDNRHDLWIHHTIYLRGDQRQRRFLSPPPFVPFSDRWKEVRDSVQ